MGGLSILRRGLYDDANLSQRGGAGLADSASSRGLSSITIDCRSLAAVALHFGNTTQGA
jgi:hypothetical protein